MTNALTLTTPTDTEIVMIRSFDAPPSLLFDALTRPELLVRWHGAHGWNLVVCEVDLRVGGAWRFVSRGPDGAELGHRGVYREISAPARLAYTESFDDQWFPGEAVVTATLDERAGRTGPITTLTTRVDYPSREVRDIALRSPMERGLAESYRRLDAALAATGKDRT